MIAAIQARCCRWSAFAWGGALVVRDLGTGTWQLLVATSISRAGYLWGAALGAVFRDARPYELLLVGPAYASVQGALVLNVVVEPGRR